MDANFVLAFVLNMAAGEDSGSGVFNWPPLGYISFLLGIVGNDAAQWALDRRAEKFTRRVMRKGLAAEFIRNLRILDNYDEVLPKIFFGDRSLNWPTGRRITAVIESSLDPKSLALLTAIEQGKIPLIYSQLNRLRDDMTDAYDGIRSHPHLRNWHAERLHTNLLPVGMNLVDALCVVLVSQDTFSSKHAAHLSKVVIETELATERTPNRLWRTSDFVRTVGSQPSINRKVYVWRDDDPTKIPEGTTVVLIHPPNTVDSTIDSQSSSWMSQKRRRDSFDVGYVGSRSRTKRSDETTRAERERPMRRRRFVGATRFSGMYHVLDGRTIVSVARCLPRL